ncbi:hypothetical protein [Photobacterium damselae]|uniref:hypothetical protein n=1 Tax=Photobacterium damselae TaxID=38293 RepID=UPI001302CC41|nr:hypothetical protein [Photobacterium damselae]
MTLIKAALTLPAELLPGGLPLQAQKFGFNTIHKEKITSNDHKPLVKFHFSDPILTTKTIGFERGIATFLNHVIEGAPYEIEKIFSVAEANSRESTFYKKNNKMISNEPLTKILSDKRKY